MALPSGITTCTLTLGADVDPSGDEVAARWTITPVVLRGGQPEPVKLVHATTGVAIIPIPEVVTVGPGGTATIVLPRTSDANIVDAATNLKADWVLLAECRWQRGRGQDSDFTARKAFRLTTATADFDLVAPVELVPASTPIMTVAPHDHSSIYPSRTEMTNLIQGITGVDVSKVLSDMGPIAPGTNLDTLTTPGLYPIRAGGHAGGGDTATGRAGTLVVLDTQNVTGNMQTQIRFEDGELMSMRTRNSAGAWQKWVLLATSRADAATPAAARRDAVVAGGLTRRGGVIGTGGRGAVALRFDHHTRPFLDKVLPLLRQHQLPWGQMLNANRLGGAGTEAGTAAEMQTACLDAGGEAWNHSWSHSDVTTVPQAEREITQGLTDLRAALPRLWIDGWAGPGQPLYLGLEGSDTIDKWWSTETGRRVLAQHAFVRGYYPGPHTHLNGPDLVGGPHITIDSATQAYCESAIRQARDSIAGVTFMLHPNYLDQSGYMTTATLAAILAYLAARRDAGELEVLTPTGILMADSSRPRTSLRGAIEAGTIPAGGWTSTVNGRDWSSRTGVPHELGATLTGTGNATLTITITTPSGTITSTRTRALTSTPTRHAVVATPPLDATAITLTITAPGAQHLGITYRPI